MKQQHRRRALAGVVVSTLASVLVLGAHAANTGVIFARVAAVLLFAVAILFFRFRPKYAEAAIGPCALAAIHAAIAATGGLAGSAIHPLVYVLLALTSALLPLWPAVSTALLAIGFEIAVHLVQGPAVLPITTLVAHLGLMALFSAMFAALLGAEAFAIKKKGEDEVREVLDRVEQDARDFRLISSALTQEPRESSGTRDPSEILKARKVSSVRAIRESLVDVLEVARLSVKADAAMLFLLNEEGTKLKLKECSSGEAERSIVEKPIPASEGALGAVVKTRRSVNLCPREGGRGLGYRTRSDVGSFLGVPVLDQGHLAGVLAVDRTNTEAFGDAEEELLDAMAREAQRAIESERIFADMDRVKYEQERLYEAFALLNEALSLEAFSQRLLEATQRIKKLDFACVTLFDEEKELHTIVGALGKEELRGASFANKEGGLVAMALKNGHRLPYVPLSEQADRASLELFGKLKHPDLKSVKVFPMAERGKPLGTLVLGSVEKENDLSREEERMIDVVSSHAAITLANARMYAKMEEMATRDGLTGLVNRRRFNELLDEAFARATRFERKISVMMVDADHFKSVNDTYGHPVGDLVLKRIASLLQGEARRTDVVARYGGEEFVVILDETDLEGARQVAERVREKIEAEQIRGDFGRIKVTASLGIACWPDHATTPEELLERADQALYEAKKKGRNRVVLSAARCASPDRAAIRREERAT